METARTYGYMPHLMVISLILGGLAVVARFNYLLFHSLVEFASAAVAVGIFFVVWNARRFFSNGFVLVVGVAYLYVGLLDLVHSLAYKDMGVFPGLDADPATQLWMAARFLESGSLLVALAFARRRISGEILQVVYLLVTAALVASILFGIFPACFVEGSGLTPFKIVGEYLVIAGFGVCLLLLVLRPGYFDHRVRWPMIGFFVTRILSELAFTTYGGVFDDANMVGHLLKVVGFYLLYQAAIEVALSRPYNLLFRDLDAAREALRFNEERFRLAIEPAPVTVFSQDRELRFDWTYNFPVGDVIGKTDADFLPDPDAAAMIAIKRQVLESGVGMRRQVSLESAGGCFEVTIEPLRDPAGAILGIVGTAIDVTELNQARAEAERVNQAKSRFLAAASHDLRQPFQAMRLFHHLLASTLTETRQVAVAGKLDEAMRAGEDLLNALLDISTLDAGTLQKKIADLPLMEVIGAIGREFEPQAAAKGLTLRVVASTAVVRTDPMLLSRVVRNLIANALRYTERGRILVGCRRQGEDVRVEVWDSGVGIPRDQLDAIFDDFYQLSNPERNREQGLGLGLAIVARIAKLLDLRVDVRSLPGKGSVFSITVPRAGATTPGPAEEKGLAPTEG